MRRLIVTAAILLLSGADFLHAQQEGAPSGRSYQLNPAPKTTEWGYYDPKMPRVLRINSGDTVEIQTLLASTPERFASAGIADDQIKPVMLEIFRQVERGPGAHILTGPIYIEGAEPGDVFEVRIEKIRLAIPYELNAFSTGRDFLPDDYPYARTKVIPLDESRMVAHFSDSIDVPIRPFFGSMGVAPPAGIGRINSDPPWIHAGNLDNKDLIAGTTFYIPVHTAGALFKVGDGHAGQGNGEVDVTAMETSLVGAFQFVVCKDIYLRWPRAETPTHYITMGFSSDLSEAAKIAVPEMIDFLTQEKHMSRDDAHMLSSVAANLEITQVVDGNDGAHMKIPKAIFVKANHLGFPRKQNKS